MERTLIIVKPDGVQRGLIGDIISRFERRGLKIVEGLVRYITSAPVVVMVLEGNDAISIARRTMGATKPAEAAPGTIRADFALEIGRNLVHGSDGPETAAKEIGLFFTEDELLSWGRDTDPWIFE